MEGIEEENEKKARALSVLTDDSEQLALSAFSETTRLVGSIGDETTRLLLLYATAYHRDEIGPHLIEGMRLDAHLDIKLFQTHMADMRRSKQTATPACQASDPARLFINAISEFAWLMETRLWEAKAVCLRGISGDSRDEVYLAVLRLMEIRWLAYSMTPVDLREGDYPGIVDNALNERWVRGLLPTAEAAQAASDRLRAERGVTIGKLAVCHDGCICDEMKKKAKLRIYFPDYPDEERHTFTRQRRVIRMGSVVPVEDIPGPDQEEVMEDLFDEA